MAIEKTEFTFPDPDGKEEKFEIEIEGVEGRTNVLEKPKEKPAKKAEDLEIEVVDDTPAKDRKRKAAEPPAEVTDEELQEYSDKVKKRIQHFSRGYHDERRAKEQAIREREELERLAQQLLKERDDLKVGTTKAQNSALEHAKHAATIEVESAKKAFKEAHESGDSDKVLAAQDALTGAKIKLDRIQGFKPAPLQEQKVDVKQPQQPSQPVKPDERAEKWASENSWFGADDEMTAFALGLHNKLVKQGMDPKSDKYYETINSRMRQVFPDQFDAGDEDEPEVQPARKERAAQVVAPATRGTAAKKIKLTQTQVQLAKRLGVPLELYAQKVAEQQRMNNG